MPFWRSEDDHRKPVVRLEHLGRKWFKLEDGFLYKIPYEPARYPVSGGARTDLASVPWRLWWLVASYGRHTRAALLHDALVEPQSPVSRMEADRIFFIALEEGRKQSGGRVTRHWLMWLAVSVFGTMRDEARWRYRLFVSHLLAFWASVVVLAAGGTPWIGLVPRVGGESWFEVERSVLASVVAAVFVLGFVWIWAPRVSRRLGYVLWPTAVFWVPIIVPAIVFVEIAVRVIQLADAVGGGGGPAGSGWKWPTVEPWRLPAPSVDETD